MNLKQITCVAKMVVTISRTCVVCPLRGVWLIYNTVGHNSRTTNRKIMVQLCPLGNTKLIPSFHEPQFEKYSCVFSLHIAKRVLL